MNKKKFLFIFLIIFVFIFFIFIFNNMTKKIKSGNNMSSQEIVDYILNINSYKAKVTVNVNSNKNKNKYILRQEYCKEDGFIQEAEEPENIKGVKIVKKDNSLIIQNTELDLKKIFENYNELENNCLNLNNFINEYKINSNSSFEDNNDYLILKVKSSTDNKYYKNEKLYIDKVKRIPIKLLIQDNNQNTTILIEYNEIELK